MYDALSVRDHMLLQLWGRRWKRPAARDRAAEHELGYTPTAAALRVAALCTDPAAIAAYPVITRSLRQARSTRRRAA